MSENNNVKVLKSGVWYTAANFVMKSIGFITTPIFTRLFSHNDYGLYSNYTSWLSLFTIFATLNFGASFISARFDFEEKFDSYISSTLVLSSIITCTWVVIINIFSSFFTTLTDVESRYINIMMIYLIAYSAIDMFQARERYRYEYKISVVISLLITILTSILSILLVLNFENRLFGRIVGSAIPTIIIGDYLYILLMFKGRKVSIEYWKYALPICLPYVPHLLSLTLLNSMDKMMITKICGAEENALYSVAYSCGAVITLLVTSLNTAFSPWLGEKLNEEKYDEIRRVSKYYIMLFVFGACGIMLLTPELLLIMGGRSYREAIYVMPPVAFGCVCQFMYTMYVNVEQFKKKTIGMAFASIVSALSNYVLNSIFIPKLGYIVAAYTTLFSFAILLFIHMLLVCHMRLQEVYSTKMVFAVIGFMSSYTALIHVLYLNDIVRYIILTIYATIVLYIGLKNKEHIIMLLKRKTKDESN